MEFVRRVAALSLVALVASCDAVFRLDHIAADAPGAPLDSLGDALDPSLVGWWQLDEGVGVKASDSSGSGNDGALTNGAAWTTGRTGGGVVFDGVDDYVRVAESASLAGTDEMTVSLWLFATARTAGLNPRLCAHLGAWDIKLNYDSPQLTLASGPLAISASHVPLDEWHHLAVVFARGAVTFYLDGVKTLLSDTTFVGGENLGTGVELRFGAAGPTTDPFTGSLDDIRLYNRALAATEVSALAL
jgi:hypothetical protein